MATTIITVEKVPKKFFRSIDKSLWNGDRPPCGVTFSPKKSGGFQKIEVYIQEKMSQYATRVAIAHELMHCLQYLTGCQMEERNTNEIDVVMVSALVDKPKGRKKT
jgi:uncharacterized protein YjaZ